MRVAQTLLQLFVTVVVLGLDPLVAPLVGVVAAFHGMPARGRRLSSAVAGSGQATRPNHQTDSPAAVTTSSAPSAANSALTSVSFFSTTRRLLSD